MSKIPRIAQIVGDRNVPRAFISLASSDVTWQQCSTESTPATTAFHEPCDADRVRGDAATPLVRLVDRGLQLLGGERRERRVDPGREDAAGRDDLDHARTALDLLADRAAGRPRASRPRGRAPMLCPCPPVIVSARPAASTRGPGDQALVDREPHVTDHGVHPAKIAHGRDAALPDAAPRCARP